MSGEMLERRFITISTLDKLHFVRSLRRQKEPSNAEVIQRAQQSLQESMGDANGEGMCFPGLFRCFGATPRTLSLSSHYTILCQYMCSRWVIWGMEWSEPNKGIAFTPDLKKEPPLFFWPLYIYMHKYISSYIFIFMFVYMYIYIHIHVHSYTFIYEFIDEDSI